MAITNQNFTSRPLNTHTRYLHYMLTLAFLAAYLWTGDGFGSLLITLGAYGGILCISFFAHAVLN